MSNEAEIGAEAANKRALNDNSEQREEFVKKLKEYQSRVAAWITKIWSGQRLRRFWSIPRDDDFREHDDYKTALDFYRKFEQKEDVDYSGVIEYAKQLYERFEKADKALDEKADSIIKYLGGGSAVVTFGALLSIKLDNWATCLVGMVALCCLVPSLLCAVQAVRAAIQVRRPRSSALPPPVKFAVEMAEFHKTKEKTELNLWLMFHPLCEAANYRNFQKSKWVETAHWYYQLSIGFLLVPVAGITATLLFLYDQLPVK